MLTDAHLAGRVAHQSAEVAAWAAGIVIPAFIWTISWIVGPAVVAVFAIRLLAAMA